MTRAKAQTSGDTVTVNLDEMGRAMMREMEKTLQKGKTRVRDSQPDA